MALLGLTWAGILFGAALLVRAVIPKRDDRRCCRKCRYDMTGVPGTTCPECGATLRKDRQRRFAPTRRRGILLSALLFLVAYGGHLGRRAVNDGWETIIPTTALIIAYPTIEKSATCQQFYAAMTTRYTMSSVSSYPYLPPAIFAASKPATTADKLWAELVVRGRKDDRPMWGWQLDWLIHRAISLPSNRGVNMLRALGGWDVFNKDHCRRIVEAAAPTLVLLRDQTPIGAPIYASINPRYRIMRCVLEIRAKIPGSDWIDVSNDNFGLNPANIFTLGSSQTPIDNLEIEIRRRDMSKGFEWTGTVTTRAAVRGDIDAALPPCPADPIDQWLGPWMNSELELLYVRREGVPGSVDSDLALVARDHRFGGSNPGQPGPLPQGADNIAVVVNIDLLRGERPIGSGQCVWSMIQRGGAYEWSRIAGGDRPVVIDQDQFWEAVRAGEPLRLRATPGDPDAGLMVIEADHRWEGEASAPLGSSWAGNYTDRRLGWDEPPDQSSDQQDIHTTDPNDP
ncbi:MAG: hypothetical protein H6814_07470 [Phycisphaeraceae bacterium]|nr:hypothetical protein [Phycisphaeraceae bacterium]